jgi:NAD(P)-dependent dehydrogenase (short-subunit alcohol dehydrogenase family)
MSHAATSALIVGGTQGLGLAIAERLAEEGCSRIAITGRDTAKGEAAAKSVGARFIAADLADLPGLLAAVDEADAQFGGLTALVNAAALTDRGSILDTTPELWDRVMAANAKAPFFTLQRAAQKALAAKRPLSTVNILSMVVHCGQSFLAPYSTSKAALANVTKNAAQALRQHRIGVNVINWGWMDPPGVDLTQRTYLGGGVGWVAEAAPKQPFGMLVKPAQVAGLAAFMLSDASGVMTGSIVDFDQNIAGAYPE